MAEYLPARGKQRTNSLVCFAHVRSLCFTCLTAFIANTEFAYFYPPNSLSLAAAREQESGYVVFSFDHNTDPLNIRSMKWLLVKL